MPASARAAHVGAGAGIVATLDCAIVLLQRRLDQRENRIVGDPDLAAAWRAVRHVEQTARGPKPAIPPSPPR